MLSNMASDLYSKGTRVWVRHPTSVWVSATVLSDYAAGQPLLLRVDDTCQEQVLQAKSELDLPPLRNPDILLGENDLTSLSYLHEPAVLYNLHVRFCERSAIYTYCGIVLVAINPYQELPIFDQQTVWAYRGRALGDLEPHIFAIAEEAYTKMERVSRDQSIIVSGESGAGKTVSAKLAMRYFATVGGGCGAAVTATACDTQVESRVLASNPVMEAIGNAKTVRNDNSSRFGKFTEISFGEHLQIQAANMRTYLLEKSRVVFQAAGERNYHIFYQLCAGRHLDEFAELFLEPYQQYAYLTGGVGGNRVAFDDVCVTADDTDDFQRLQHTRQALATLGIDVQAQATLWRVLAATLHLGNVRLAAGGGDDSCSVLRDDTSLPMVSRLLSVDHEQIRHWLCKRRIVSSHETITKNMTLIQANAARDALAKFIYAQTFNWVVRQINKCLTCRYAAFRFIGILDIYGFETFDCNSFEQFCINYANEKLQQQFNQHVFKLDQEEYVREQIEWTFIDFYDNQPCIDVIEAKLGILDLLDEECKMPRGTDQSWANKLYAKCSKWRHFEKPRLSTSAFIISHFADRVQYEVSSFLDKNRDTVMQEHLDVLNASLNPLIVSFLEGPAAVPKHRKATAPTGKPMNTNKKTVGSQFRESLNLLMATLSSTTPHYVRCIKPNDNKAPFQFDAGRTVQQLRACGVLETVRISAAGFPSRWLYEDFFYRYRVLCSSPDIVRGDMKGTCRNILSRLVKADDKFKFGVSKVFFRAGQVAYLEKLRSQRLRQCAVLIQRWVRGWLQRRRYLTLKHANGTLQRWVRGYLARRRVERLRRTRAVVAIQSAVRCWRARKRYVHICRTVLALQTHGRRQLAQQRFIALRQQRAAVCIQRHVRGWRARRWYLAARRRIVLLQCCVRRAAARREFRARRIQARTLDHQRMLNKGLENKIMSMQRRITELTEENSGMRSRSGQLDSVMAEARQLRTQLNQLEHAAKQADQLRHQAERLTQQLDAEKCEKIDVVNELQQAQQDNETRLAALQHHNDSLRQQLRLSQQSQQQHEQQLQELVRLRVDAETARLVSEYERDRLSYQKLVQDKSCIEQQLDLVQCQLHLARSVGRRQRAASGVSDSLTEPVSDTDRITPDVHDELSDVGYGTARSRSQYDESLVADSGDLFCHGEQQSINSLPSDQAKADIPLLLKMQFKLRDLANARDSLTSHLERLQDDSPNDQCQMINDKIRLQDLEVDNAKLKCDLARLRESLSNESSDAAVHTLHAQFQSIQDELERRREECVQLKTLINSSAAGSRYHHHSNSTATEPVNEHIEIAMAFETQKLINRQIADELHREKAERVRLLEAEAESQRQLQLLRRENDSCRQHLMSQLVPTDSSVNELSAGDCEQQRQMPASTLQHHITRLTAENLALCEKMDFQQEKMTKLKKQLKIYAKRYKETLYQLRTKSPNCRGHAATVSTGVSAAAEQTGNECGSSSGGWDSQCALVVRHKTAEHLGMFEYQNQHEELLIKTLITDLKPDVALQLNPGVPAYIMFMCIRHMDFCDDADKVYSFMSKCVSAVKKATSRRKTDLDAQLLWLVNLCQLLNCLKQYSGDEQYQQQNTAKQNDQCLRNFELSDFRDILNELAIRTYQSTVKLICDSVARLVVPAILEHQEISNLTTGSGGGSSSSVLGALGSTVRQLTRPHSDPQALTNLLAKLKNTCHMLKERAIGPAVIAQLMRQVYHYMCAVSLNTLMLRRELCSWTRGLQIRFNLCSLEQWARENCPPVPSAVGGVEGVMSVEEPLLPIVQATQLLQSRKVDEQVATICQSCDRLTSAQIIKLLHAFTPGDCDERVPVSFIRLMQQHLDSTRVPDSTNKYIMDPEEVLTVRFPYTPSEEALEELDLPPQLGLNMLRRT